MINFLLTKEWFARLNSFNKLIVGFSGGLDSTVLLHALVSFPALSRKILAVHVNHGISPNALCWQNHCQQVCKDFDVSLKIQSVTLDCAANVEERARKARYEVFSTLMNEHDGLILGHHLDDQAETVLLQLFRGTGIDGLAAMSESGPFKAGTITRPLLTYSREHLENYAALHQLTWIEDESNQDINYSRNYLRQQIIPLLKTKWPGVVTNSARTALHCQQTQRNLYRLAGLDMGLDKDPQALSKDNLSIKSLMELNRDGMINVLRCWLKNKDVQFPSTVTFERLIDELIYAAPDANPIVSWSDVSLHRFQNQLYLERKKENLPAALEWSSFPLPLLITAGIKLVAKKAARGLVVPENTKISIRFRKGGEQLNWHGQTKRLKKLFQEWEIPPWLRDRIPLVYFNDILAVVVGYAMSDLFLSQNAEGWIFIEDDFDLSIRL